MAPSHPRLKPRNAKTKNGFSNYAPPGLHYLLPLDPKSQEFLDLFRSFMLSNDERATILALSDEDAKVFIEIIDKAFRAAQLDTELKWNTFAVLRELCGRMGHLPDSYLLSNKFTISGTPHASGGFSDLRKDVSVKTLRISELDDRIRIRRRFCKEVAMWKYLSHPNVLNLIGVQDTIEDGRFSMVCEWMANGNIVEYVRAIAGNHLKLLRGAVRGLAYLHRARIVHGDLKGSNVLITNTNPVSACLVDFGFMTIVHDPKLKVEAAKAKVDQGTTPFMAPERLVPSRFELERDTPTREADVYAMGMVIYQVLTGALPFGKQTGSEVISKVLQGTKPSKPTNAMELGISDNVWRLLEDCWQTERQLRPPVKNVLDCVKSAASACGTLPPVEGIAQRHEDPESPFSKFDRMLLGMTSDDQGDIRGCLIKYPPSQGSITSTPDSLFPELSETSEPEASMTELCLADPYSRSSTPGSKTPTQSLFRGNSGPYPHQNKTFAESSGSDRTPRAPLRRDQPRPDTDAASTISTAMPYDSEPPVADPVASTDLFVPDTAVINMAHAKENSTRQLNKPPSMISLRSSKSRPIERGVSPQPDENAKDKS